MKRREREKGRGEGDVCEKCPHTSHLLLPQVKESIPGKEKTNWRKLVPLCT